MRKGFYLIFIFFLLKTNLFSQSKLDAPLRGEILAKEIDYVNFVPIGELGLIVFGHSEEVKNKRDVWKIECFDNTFKLKWKKEFLCLKNMQIVEYTFSSDSIIDAFFSSTSFGYYDYTKIRLNIFTGAYTSFDYSGEKNIEIDHFNVLKNTVFISGIQKPGFLSYVGQFFYTFTIYPIFSGSKIYSIRPVVKCYNFEKNERYSNVPNIKGSSSTLCNQVDTARNVFISIVKNQFKNTTKLIYFEYNNKGEMLLQKEMNTLDNKNILTGSLLFSENGDLLFAGTFSDGQGTNRQGLNVSDGMFFGKIEQGSTPEIKFYKFYEFKNTFGTLSFSQMKRFSQRKQNNKPTDISFNLLMHKKITYVDSTYILLAENYYPEYHNEVSYDSRGMMNQQEIFDGFRYTHAIAAGFDVNGNLIWDNLMEINDILSMRLQENVLVFQSGKEQAMVYYNDGALNTKVFKGNQVIAQKSTDEIPTVKKNEKVIYEDFGQIYHWYGDFFLITSYQKVLESGGEKRKVYNFNKLIFQ